MRRFQRELWHAAQCIAEQLTCQATDRAPVVLPNSIWRSCQRLARAIHTAETRGWSAAADRSRQQLATTLQALPDQISQLQASLRSVTTTVPATCRDIYCDLLALQNELVQVRFDRSTSELTVTTDEINLEGIPLGPFEIVLECRRLNDSSPYQVVAREPLVASVDSHTTHPHVQDDVLCEGEGRTPLARALSQGRLFDFFLLVRQILGTYNAASAYVSVDQWHGYCCRDCARTLTADERQMCARCEGDLCVDCAADCGCCKAPLCDDCHDSCLLCLHAFCEACLQRCDKCDSLTCEDCLTDEKKCSDCS